MSLFVFLKMILREGVYGAQEKKLTTMGEDEFNIQCIIPVSLEIKTSFTP